MAGKEIKRPYVYRAEFERGAKRGNIVVTFSDVPEVVTQGRGEVDARGMAEEVLGLVLLTYFERGMPLPKPRAKGANSSRSPSRRMWRRNWRCWSRLWRRASARANSRRIGKDEKEVRRILDPKHATKLPALIAALRALGKRLVVGVTEEAA